jgi:hypothetical protein
MDWIIGTQGKGQLSCYMFLVAWLHQSKEVGTCVMLLQAIMSLKKWVPGYSVSCAQIQFNKMDGSRSHPPRMQVLTDRYSDIKACLIQLKKEKGQCLGAG